MNLGKVCVRVSVHAALVIKCLNLILNDDDDDDDLRFEHHCIRTTLFVSLSLFLYLIDLHFLQILFFLFFPNFLWRLER